MASSVSHPSVCAVIDARRGAVFAGRYQTEETLAVLTSDRYTTLAQIQQADDWIVAAGRPNLQRAEAFKYRVHDLHALTPQYLRQTEAEANYDRQAD